MNHVDFDAWILAISIVKLITVVFGLTFIVYSVRAWLKHRSRAMLLLSIGIALLTSGLLAEGFLVMIVGTEMGIAHLVEASFALVGFFFLAASIVTVRTHRVRRRIDDRDDAQAGTTRSES